MTQMNKITLSLPQRETLVRKFIMSTVLSTDRPSGEVSTEEMNKLIDLDRYPIDRLQDKVGQMLVAQCRSDLDDCAAAILPSFVTTGCDHENG